MKTKIVVILDNWMHFLFKNIPPNFEKLCDLRDSLETGLSYKDLYVSRKRNSR